MSLIGGGFNRSTQHLLILPDEEVCAVLGKIVVNHVRAFPSIL